MFYSKWLHVIVAFMFTLAHADHEHHEPHAELHTEVILHDRKKHSSPRAGGMDIKKVENAIKSIEQDIGEGGDLAFVTVDNLSVIWSDRDVFYVADITHHFDDYLPEESWKGVKYPYRMILERIKENEET